MRSRPGLARLAGTRGSAPAGLLAWIGVTVVLIGAIGLLGQGASALARASTAADLAALATADALAVGDPAPCSRATAVAARNGAEVLACDLEGEEAVVRVGVPAGVLGTARADARAGPGPGPGPTVEPT